MPIPDRASSPLVSKLPTRPAALEADEPELGSPEPGQSEVNAGIGQLNSASQADGAAQGKSKSKPIYAVTGRSTEEGTGSAASRIEPSPPPLSSNSPASPAQSISASSSGEPIENTETGQSQAPASEPNASDNRESSVAEPSNDAEPSTNTNSANGVSANGADSTGITDSAPTNSATQAEGSNTTVGDSNTPGNDDTPGNSSGDSNTSGNGDAPGNQDDPGSNDTSGTSAAEDPLGDEASPATGAEDDGAALNAVLPEDDFTNALPEDSVTFQRTNDLAQGAADLYRFGVEETGIFTAALTGLSADADVQLIQDKNENGQLDSGEIVAWEWEQGNLDESIRHFLQPGDYVLRVMNQDISPAPTRYSIATTFEASATDNRAFSINVVYKTGVEQLNEAARAAVERAADYWENVISHSSFDRSLEFALGLYGTTNRENPFLAYAGPQSYRETGDKLLPVVGVAVLNNLYLEQYNSNPDYLESVLRHEIGHTLGVGTIWDRRGNDLVDQDNGVYRAETYAGQAYGELLGTGLATAVPLDRNSLTHWDEEIFDAELMTPRAEGVGEPLPMSQLTISSLRDLGWNVNYGAAEAFSLDSSEMA